MVHGSLFRLERLFYPVIEYDSSRVLLVLEEVFYFREDGAINRHRFIKIGFID